MNFIIVEDNNLHRKMIKETIMDFMMKNKLDFDILEFEDETKELRKTIKNKKNNIYVLDFELPTSNAIDIARLIRESDWRSPIIILTAHGGMALETFKQRLQILDFLNKQFKPQKNLLELFEICLKQLDLSSSLKFRMKNTDYVVSLESIYQIYRETIDRKIVIVAQDEEYRLNSSMKKIYSKLDKNFLYSDKASIINMKKVKKLDWKNHKIVFVNGKESFLLSRTHKKELKKYGME